MHSEQSEKAHVAALEKAQADIHAALKVIGETQQVFADAMREYVASLESTLRSVSALALDTNERAHSIEQTTAEIKRLLERELGSGVGLDDGVRVGHGALGG
ncbi:hypothetical protein [Mycobacterium spongiae]|uniref:Uncharacterized protein n=1 Tax=Mycobacterium spongiae TaxID=886343 RepID=A0A975K1P5_9MYCO|nr:hypothetical protein [Mycobacterium spongiae]QUR69438.1 hypothetical protein F6B93_22280 [Mycobacterium spongiae]